MEIIYRAFDGKDFDDEDECRTYELLTEFSNKPSAVFATTDGEIFTLKDILEEQYAIEDAIYIYCANYEAYNNTAEVFDEFGSTFPEWDSCAFLEISRCWMWDETVHYGSWVDLGEKLSRFDTMKKIYEKLAEKGLTNS